MASVRKETEMAAHPVEQVAVAVAVPESYFKKVWHERNPAEAAADGSVEPKTPQAGDIEPIRTQEVANIRSCVTALLPKPAGLADPVELVTVTVFPFCSVTATRLSPCCMAFAGQTKHAYWSGCPKPPS